MNLNYHHLQYFYEVAKHGSIAKASKALLLSQPTISTQIRALESAMGVELFHRSGRQLRLTRTGEQVYSFADEIFSLGHELMSTLDTVQSDPALRLHVGIGDFVPKLVTRMILQPALDHDPAIHMVCRHGRVSQMLPDLATHRLDLVIATEQADSRDSLKTYSHLLGESPIGIFGNKKVADRLREDFPQSLEGQSILLPVSNSSLRKEIDQWIARQNLNMRVMAEFEDTSLIKAFAMDLPCVCALPTVISDQAATGYGLHLIGQADNCILRFYAISAERKLKHPGVLAITDKARGRIFQEKPSDNGKYVAAV